MRIDTSNDIFVDLQCPYCNSPLTFLETKCGTAQECPFCSETIVIAPDGPGKAGKLAVPIKTTRLTLRALNQEDLSVLLEFMKDEDSYKYLISDPPNEEQMRAQLERSKVFGLAGAEGRLSLGIELLSESRIIGEVTLHLADPEEHRQGSFHIIVDPA